MNTLILRETTRVLFTLILVFSVATLLRGHDAPGGGFVGGLIASTACCLYVFVADAKDVRRLVRTDPLKTAAAGLALAILSGLIGILLGGRPFLSGEWAEIGGVEIGTPLLFDFGVYLVVVGAVLTFVLEIKEPGAVPPPDSEK
ncbi:MAG: hypothetical protein OXN96_07425 [Bryobacterales bacterium]|nr:hypothetical protein [Bryobacterales bacterium]